MVRLSDDLMKIPKLDVSGKKKDLPLAHVFTVNFSELQ